MNAAENVGEVIKFQGKVIKNPTLEELNEKLLQKNSEPLYLHVHIEPLSEHGFDMPVLILGMLRYGKSLDCWKVTGLYMTRQMQLRTVELHFDFGRNIGALVLDPPSWGSEWML